ncbi:hypothetical protein R3W88_010630 [Solanum pinnatisectum]|uniref:GCK domain-containing protein n=1 Tax=Solanum pinnatisectum TaxID=50273 RepID=A0AAV9L3V6_9SOLN|nr:hypothetical protein R3W88_010630 [Solanum pinnatisectum]
MGDNYLPPLISNPSSTNSTNSTTMSSSSSNSPQTHEPNPQSNTNTKTQEELIKKDEEKQDDEDEEECGFCLFMKEGGCRDPFIDWEKCVEQGEKNNEDIAEKCFQVTSALQKCMEAHSDYYAPILQVEKDVEAKVIAEFEKNRESIEQKEEM